MEEFIRMRDGLLIPWDTVFVPRWVTPLAKDNRQVLQCVSVVARCLCRSYFIRRSRRYRLPVVRNQSVVSFREKLINALDSRSLHWILREPKLLRHIGEGHVAGLDRSKRA